MDFYFENFKHFLEFPLKNPVQIFSLVLFIILFSPIFLKKLKIPGIIGLILSGVIIGPYGFNIIIKNSAVELFSTIGILYIMFIAGLELDMNEFKVHKNKSLFFGFLTFIFPLTIGFPVCHYLLGYDINASFLTASMFSTHTLVSYTIVSKLGISKNQAVAVSVGGTIFTDTVVLLILAVILGNSKGYLNEKFFIRLISSLTIFMGIMTFLVPKISKWFFQKLEGEKHAHYIYVLLIVFTSALLSEIAGLEPIIGAFVAGLVLNRLIPASSALMNRIEFIGNSLFIPFFLISVGMLVDLKILLNGPQALIVAGTLIIVSLVGKWAAAFFTQITFRYSTNQRKLIFGLSSAHAAATLAIILVGYKNNIIDENILNGTIVLILITCIVASFVTEKAAKAILQEDEGASYELDIHSSLNDEHILLPVANTANLDKLLEFALLIKDKKSVNPVTILSVVPNNEEAEVNIQKSKKKLEEFVKLGASSEIKVNTISTIDHNAANGIVRVSRELVSDLIIMGWPQKAGLIERIIGEKIPSIIDNVDKQLFICRLHESFVSHNLIKIFNLPFAEKEKGFSLWVWKISMLSLELGIPVVHYGTSKTQKAIQAELSRRNINIIISYKVMESPEDFLEKIVEENELDLVIFISARKGALSYHSSIESIPAQLENKWKGNIVIVYP